jgi:hypothetical protein
VVVVKNIKNAAVKYERDLHNTYFNVQR